MMGCCARKDVLTLDLPVCYTDICTSTAVLEGGKLSGVVDPVFPSGVVDPALPSGAHLLRVEHTEEESGEMVGLGESDLHHHYHVIVSSQ